MNGHDTTHGATHDATGTTTSFDEDALAALVDDDPEGDPVEVVEEGEGGDTERPWRGLVGFARGLVPDAAFETRRPAPSTGDAAPAPAGDEPEIPPSTGPGMGG